MKFGGFRRTFDEIGFGQLVDILTTGLTKLTLSDNIDGQIIENITIPAGTEVGVPHGLKKIPKYRTILRQTGGGTILDGVVNNWTNTAVYLKNDGASEAIVTIFLHRS